MKEYTYTQSNDPASERPLNVREYGFSYVDSDRNTSPLTRHSSGATRSPPTTSSTTGADPQKLVTGLAFTYKPDSSNYPDNQKQPTRPSTLTSPSKSKMTKDLKSPGYMQKTTAVLPLDKKQSKLKATTIPDTFGSGRFSRQSKDSKLEELSSNSSISSGSSSLDEYEKESYPVPTDTGTKKSTPSSQKKTKPTVMPKPQMGASVEPILSSSSIKRGIKSPPPPTKPKPTSLFDYQPSSTTASYAGYSGPKITHASRKRMVTNADGSTYETEEILEPSTMLTSKTKPVVVGVLPSTQDSVSISSQISSKFTPKCLNFALLTFYLIIDHFKFFFPLFSFIHFKFQILISNFVPEFCFDFFSIFIYFTILFWKSFLNNFFIELGVISI